jgi:hypothetical protein
MSAKALAGAAGGAISSLHLSAASHTIPTAATMTANTSSMILPKSFTRFHPSAIELAHLELQRPQEFDLINIITVNSSAVVTIFT